jgi:type I restriction enzyme S subunit
VNDWPEVALADVCGRPQYGAIAKGSKEPVGPRFVRQTDITTGRIDWRTVPYCDLGQADFEKYAIQAGDLLISRLGAGVGTAATVDDGKGAVFAGYLVRFQPDVKVADPRFIGYELRSPNWWNHVNSFRSGAAQPTLNAQQMGAFRFSLPPHREQERIAAALGTLDDKVESDRRTIELAGELLDTIADEAATSLPMTTLAALADVNRSTTNPAGLGEDMVDHYSLPAFDEAVWPERVAASSIMSNKLLVTERSILLSRLNPRFNRTWWAVPEGDVTALASTEFTCLTAETRTDLASVWLALRDANFREELVRRVTGTSGSHQRIRPDDMLAIDVPDTRQLADDVKQSALATLELIHSRRREIVELSALRDVLLPELLSGRIRVPEAVEAVA